MIGVKFRGRALAAGVFAAATVFAQGCGLGSAGVASVVGGTDPPVIIDTFIADFEITNLVDEGANVKVNPVLFKLKLFGPSSGMATVSFFEDKDKIDGEGVDNDVLAKVFDPATGAMGSALVLATNPNGMPHSLEWPFTNTGFQPGVTLWARVGNQVAFSKGANGETFGLGNDAPELSALSLEGMPPVLGMPSITGNPPAPGRLVVAEGVLEFSFNVCDSSSDDVEILVDYTTELQNEPPPDWKKATALGHAQALFSTNPCPSVAIPAANKFLWNSPADLGTQDGPVRVRFKAFDGVAESTSFEVLFELDNNEPPSTALSGDLFIANDDERRGLVIPFETTDIEGDFLRMVFQFRRPGESFPPLDVDLAGILADPAKYRIATPFPVAWEGQVVADLGPSGGSIGFTTRDFEARMTLPLPVVAGEDELAPLGIEVELLRPSMEVLELSGLTGDFTPVSPVAAVPIGRGTSALVLDNPGAAWRLTEVDLARGDTLSGGALSTGTDTAYALALSADQSTAYVASGSSSDLWITPVALSGDLPPGLGEKSFPVSGTVHQIEVAAEGVVYAAVGGSIYRLELFTAQNNISVTGIPGVRGLALDPRFPSRAYATNDGGVWELDVGSGESRLLFASGDPVGGPDGISFNWSEGDAIALDPVGSRLVFTAHDESGNREVLIAFDLNDGGAGELGGGWTSGVGGVAVGPDGMVALALTMDNNLAVGGGVEQVRDLGSISKDGTEFRIAQGTTFDPDPRAGQQWRVPRNTEFVRGGSATMPAKAIFVWDTRDLVGGGQALLRATAFDADMGGDDEAAVFKPVRHPLDVVPTEVVGPVSVQLMKLPPPGGPIGAGGLDLADLDGDGDLEIVLATTGSGLTAYERDASGAWTTYSLGLLLSAPGVVLDVTVADLDGDQLVDLITAEPVVLEPGSGNPGSTEPDPVAPPPVHTDLVFRLQQPDGKFGMSFSRMLTGRVVELVTAELTGDTSLDVLVVTRRDVGDPPVQTDRVVILTNLDWSGGGGGIVEEFSLDISDGGAVVGVATQDVDEDGLLDFVAAVDFGVMAGGELRTWIGKDPVAFGNGTGEPFTLRPTGVAGGDIDGDGDLEWVVTFRNETVALWDLDNMGLPSGVPLVLGLPTSLSLAEPRVADLDGDGTLDLAMGSRSLGSVVILTGDLTGDLTGVPGPSILIAGDGELGARVDHLLSGDVDGDGLVDLVALHGVRISGTTFEYEVDEHRAVGAGTFGGQPDAVLGGPGSFLFESATRAGDLDGDGDLDLVTARDVDVRVLSQSGAGVFEPAVLVPVPAPAAPSSVGLAMADLNGDGLLDVATTHGGLSVLYSSPLGPATTTALVNLGTLVPDRLCSGDFNGDGLVDLVAWNALDNRYGLLEQSTTPGVFTEVLPDPQQLPPTLVAMALQLADLDEDGHLDLVTANKVVAFHENRGVASNPQFEAPIGLTGTTLTDPGSLVLAVEDLDSDGRLDVATGGDIGENEILVYSRSESGSFGLVPPLRDDTLPFLAVELAVADVDGDGDSDLIASDETSLTNDEVVLRVWEQLSPGRFAPAPRRVLTTGALRPRSLAVVDVDFDGDLDCVLTSWVTSQVFLLWGSH